MERVIVNRPFLGLLYMQVCAVDNATDEEILKVANRDNKCGTTLGWCDVAREDHKKVELRPVCCEQELNRKHFICIC